MEVELAAGTIEESDAALAVHGLRIDNEADDRAEAYRLRVQRDMTQQFQLLKDQSQALFGMVEGRPGVRSPAEWAKLLERAGDEIGNGRFIVRCLGAERYLDAATVAVLVTFRQNLIFEIDNPSTADVMNVDAAVLAYFNLVRIQGWIGNAALVVEREFFGQAPLSEIHGLESGECLREQLYRLSEIMLPLLDRSDRMMKRSLASLPRNPKKRSRLVTA